MKQNIFICLPIIIEIKIYKWSFPFPPRKNVKLFIYGEILLNFETQQFHMCTWVTVRKNLLPSRRVAPTGPRRASSLPFDRGRQVLLHETPQPHTCQREIKSQPHRGYLAWALEWASCCTRITSSSPHISGQRRSIVNTLQKFVQPTLESI